MEVNGVTVVEVICPCCGEKIVVKLEVKDGYRVELHSQNKLD
jgi:hypothetical protein